ncbi:hypothetical protein ANO14919_020850 [Xylariales sp. No.14919]|nr:hypothetical protein ANO14919_020850 [Xylariales sp. No.14919]
MFKWYEYATICYAYLHDIGSTKSDYQTPEDCDLGSSRWFTRGWTLQELIAPFEVIIYDCEWKQLATKRRLAKELEKITRIPEEVLLDPTVRCNKSVAARMSWARGRQTTRIEDGAYCLLGLFDINMPLLYGEGNKALSRLHGEILNTIEDDTVFLGGLTSMDEELSIQSPGLLKTEQDFLVAPDNVLDVIPAIVRPLPGTVDQPTTQPYSYGDSSGRWQNDPRKDPRLRGDVLSMPMRIIQVIFSKRSPARIPITMKKQLQIEISAEGQQVLESFGFGGSPCLGMLRCGTDGRLVARYFLCLPVNDELLAYPTPYYRFVSLEQVYYWPYMRCHISLNRGTWKPMPRLKSPRDPASWGVSDTHPHITFGNGWTLEMKPTSLMNPDEAVSSSQLRFERSIEIWNLSLILRKVASHSPGRIFNITIKLQCSTTSELDCQVVSANHHGCEGPVTELSQRMPVLRGSAELVVSIYYEIGSTEHYYSPMIRFRAFEASSTGRLVYK